MRINYDAKELNEVGDAELMALIQGDHQLLARVFCSIQEIKMQEARQRNYSFGVVYKDKEGNVLGTQMHDSSYQLSPDEEQSLREAKAFLKRVEEAAQAYVNQAVARF